MWCAGIRLRSISGAFWHGAGGSGSVLRALSLMWALASRCCAKDLHLLAAMKASKAKMHTILRGCVASIPCAVLAVLSFAPGDGRKHPSVRRPAGFLPSHAACCGAACRITPSANPTYGTQTGWPHRGSASDTLRRCASRRSTWVANTDSRSENRCLYSIVSACPWPPWRSAEQGRPKEKKTAGCLSASEFPAVLFRPEPRRESMRSIDARRGVFCVGY